MDSYDKSILKEVFPHKRGSLSKQMIEKSFKSLILNNFKCYTDLPKINECSNLLQEIYTSVCESDAAMCHIDYNDWNEYYSEKFTKEDIEKLKEEIKEYKLEDVIEVDNGEYQILGYGNLQFMFNDTREFERESELQIE